MSADLLPSMIPHFGCVVERTPDGARLRGAGRNFMNAVLLTRDVFRAPFTITAVAKTDTTNVRLYWHVGEVIFNWECNVRELRVHDPQTREEIGIDDAGFVTTEQWHDFVWEITPTGLRVLVDGQLRYSRDGDYGSIEAPVAIGPCFGSTVTVKSFVVDRG